MTLLYLAGPMSGLPDWNYPAFHKAAAELRAAGYEVINPAEVNPDTTQPWAACLRACLAEVVRCDVIAMLPGWEKSKGARLEHHVAIELGVPAIYLPAADLPPLPFIPADQQQRLQLVAWGHQCRRG